jgi:hypothetical protein
MQKRLWSVCAGLCGLATMLVAAVPGAAQTQEIKSKPPLYSYVANWQFPRANWADAVKALEPVNEIMQKAQSSGDIVAYGNDVNLVHTRDGETHDNWWSSMSLAGLIKTLNQLHASGDANSPAMNSAKHWDEVLVSHYYNWKSGAMKGGYTHVSVYKLKADAPDDAMNSLSEHFVAPVLEKLLADGTIVEYEIDTMAIHTSAPGTFIIVYITPTPEGLDTVQGAVRDALKASPLTGDAFGSFVDDSGHRDGLYKTDANYK